MHSFRVSRFLFAIAQSRSFRAMALVVTGLALLASGLGWPAKLARAVGPTCTVNAAGGGDYTTLQAAINDVNCQTIQVSATTGVHAEHGIVVSRNVLIEGVSANANKVQIDAQGLDRVFRIAAGAQVTIRNLRMSNGVRPLAGNPDKAGGGIRNDGNLVLQNCVIDGNLAESGGGVLNFGHLDMTRCVVRSNRSFAGGGIATSNISGSSMMTINQSSIIDNLSDHSPGIAIYGPTLIVNSTIAENFAFGAIGNIGHIEMVFSGTATIVNSTIVNSQRKRTGSFLGPIIVDPSSRAILNYEGQLILKNTIVTEKQANNADGIPVCQGSLTDGGNNLASDNTCGFANVADPLLDPVGLYDDGSSTPIIALLSASPAINAGNTAVCAAAPVSGIDQRGVARPQGTGCDVGAFEFEGTPSSTSTPTPTPTPTPTALNVGNIAVRVRTNTLEPLNDWLVTVYDVNRDDIYVTESRTDTQGLVTFTLRYSTYKVCETLQEGYAVSYPLDECYIQILDETAPNLFFDFLNIPPALVTSTPTPTQTPTPTSTPTRTPDPVNIVVNGDFATGDLTGWIISGTVGVANNQALVYGRSRLSQVLNTVPGETYRFSAHVSNAFPPTCNLFITPFGIKDVDSEQVIRRGDQRLNQSGSGLQDIVFVAPSSQVELFFGPNVAGLQGTPCDFANYAAAVGPVRVTLTQDVLENGGFESSVRNFTVAGQFVAQPKRWMNCSGYVTGTLSYLVRSGEISAGMGCSQTLDTEPGTSYRVEGYFNFLTQVSSDSVVATVSSEASATTPAVILASSTPAGQNTGTGWQKVSFDFTATTLRSVLTLQQNGTGTLSAFADDFSVIKIATLPTATPTNTPVAPTATTTPTPEPTNTPAPAGPIRLIIDVQTKDYAPLEGWEVKIYDTSSSEQLVQTATTDSNGQVLTYIPAGRYKICETVKEGYKVVYPNQACYFQTYSANSDYFINLLFLNDFAVALPPTATPSTCVPLSRTRPAGFNFPGWQASSSYTGNVALAIDSSKATFWNNGVSRQGQGQWFSVDLGTQKTFNGLTLDNTSDPNNYPRKIGVYVSADGGIFTKVGEATPTGATSTFSFARRTARYVSVEILQSNFTASWSIGDFDVCAGGAVAPAQNSAAQGIGKSYVLKAQGFVSLAVQTFLPVVFR